MAENENEPWLGENNYQPGHFAVCIFRAVKIAGRRSLVLILPRRKIVEDFQGTLGLGV